MSTVDVILREAIEEGRAALLETEGLALLAAAGIAAPRMLFVTNAAELRAWRGELPASERVAIKVVSHAILHKTEAGGVRFVANDLQTIAGAIEEMETRLGGSDIRGFTIGEFIEYDRSFGGELLLGARWTDDFGPIVTLAAGGIFTEFLSASFRPRRDMAIIAPSLEPVGGLAASISDVAAARILTGGLRGTKPRAGIQEITRIIARFAAFVAPRMPHLIREIEINPLAITPRGPIALDILARLGSGETPPNVAAPRPIEKLACLLQPSSAAIIGVSEKLNPGHIILNNLLREGFDPDRLYVVKAGSESIEGCRCVPEVAALPEKVDMLVLAISAQQVPAAIREIVVQRKAESMIVIPGGLEEKEGTAEIVAGMRAAIEDARATSWRGPVINGGNCLGIRSIPGRYDTMFVPQYKMPYPKKAADPLAIISNSGAFAIARASKLSTINPRYIVSIGNQTDLTFADYLEHLKDDRQIEVFALYVEGFRAMDGLRVLHAARQIVASGRPVILYRAGRTAEGSRATASHTASVAGDYVVTRALSEQAGIVVAETIPDFEDLVRTFTLLRDKQVAGNRLGAISNAGFECVAIADTADGFEIEPFGRGTAERLGEIFASCRISEVVDVHNPVDLTPIMGDAAFADAVRAVLNDPGVDVGIVGCVPPTWALNTLASSPSHREDVSAATSVASRLVAIARECAKPWVAVVDAGPLYDPMSRILEEGGVPVFRTADRAMKALAAFCSVRRLSAARHTDAEETAIQA